MIGRKGDELMFEIDSPRAYNLFYVGTGCRKSTLCLIRGRLAIKSHQSGLYHGCAGWDRLGIAVYSLQLIVSSLRLISWLFDDKLQISCDFLGGFEEKAYFCG